MLVPEARKRAVLVCDSPRELNIFGLHHLAGSAPAIEIETKSVSSESYAATVRARQEGRVKALECIRMRAYQEVA